jgi:predicted dehydrogenase
MKIAIIGVGRMGRRHIQVVQKMNLDLMGVLDKNADSLQLAKKEGGLKDNQLFSDIDELFDVAVPECLIIATTADSHCALTCMAAKRGVKYILVEKPLAVSLDQCELMISTCKKFEAKLSVNHQMRFLEQYSKVKALMSSSVFGGLNSMTVVAGNFGMSMNGTHYLEAFRYMTDEEPFEVSAWFDNETIVNPRGAQFQDRSGSIKVLTKSGARLYMDIGGDQGHGIQVIYAGRNGQVTVNELTGEMVSSARSDQYRDLPTTRYGMPSDITHKYITPVEVIDSTAQVLRALLSGDNLVSAQQGALAVRALVAAYESSENGGRPVRLDAVNDCSRIFPWA